MVSFTQLLVASALAVAASATNWTVTANSNLTFTPDELVAAEGDWIIFEFSPANHSVVSGPFATPCRPATTGGFYGGFNFATSSGLSSNSFAIEVKNASVPIWFYCPQAEHCAKGMVGAVNPTKAKTLAAYQAGALAFNAAGVVPSDNVAFGGSIQSASAPSPSTTSTPGSGGYGNGNAASGLFPPTAALLALAGFAIVMA